MKKNIIQQKILEFLKINPWSSSTQISKYIGYTRVAIYYHLKELLSQDSIYKKWNKNATRYFKNTSSINTYKTPEFYENIKWDLVEQYHGLEDLNIASLSGELISDLWGDGVWTYWLKAFEKKIQRENNNILPDEDVLKERFTDFLIAYIDENSKRLKNNFFSGILSLKSVLARYDMPVAINQLYFTQVATLKSFPSVGRLRCSDEIYWWKQLQNKPLLTSWISLWLDTIVSFCKRTQIQHAIFTPPTITRQYQFPNILRAMLRERSIFFEEIKVVKRVSPEITFKPQKETKWMDRIVNARKSIIVPDMWEYISIPEILIFDDSFSTGATMNAIAEQLRQQWYTWKITAITLSWNFDYIPGVTDLWDI